MSVRLRFSVKLMEVANWTGGAMRYHRFEEDRSLHLRSILVTLLVCSFLVGAILYVVWLK